MSLFLRTFRSSSRALQRPAAAFSTSSIRPALSEADRDQPDREKKIEHHKQESVNQAKKGEGEWKPELASASEQGVKSDKDDKSIKEMQKLGEEKAGK